MATEIWIALIGSFTTTAGSVVSWLLAKKKYHSEVDSNYIQNLGKGLETYDAIIAHNKSEIEYLMKESEELREENKELKKENEELKRDISELRRQMLDLSLNICLDLTCDHRLREKAKNRKIVNKSKEAFNEIKPKA